MLNINYNSCIFFKNYLVCNLENYPFTEEIHNFHIFINFFYLKLINLFFLKKNKITKNFNNYKNKINKNLIFNNSNNSIKKYKFISKKKFLLKKFKYFFKNKNKNKNTIIKTKIVDNYKKENCSIFKYNYFFTNFFLKLFKKNFYFINFNYFLKVKIKQFKKIVNNIFFKNTFFKKTVYIYKIIKLMFASLIYKDSKLLIFVIKEMFEAIHYSKHRIYFVFWRNLIKFLLSKYYKKLNIYGIRLEFHGKLGVGGNSKKRSVYYSLGRCSNSTKLFKIDSSNSFFKTETGVVGFTYSIFY